MKKKILLVSGDPNSINSEIISKTLKKLNTKTKKNIYLISNYELIKKQFKFFKFNEKLLKVNNLDQAKNDLGIKIFDIKLNFKNPFNVKIKEASKFVLDSLNFANKLANNNKDICIINCPINKNLLNNKGLGVTEFLAKKNKLKNESVVMLIKNKELAVCPITTHVDIKDIPKKLKKNNIIKKIKIINNWYKSNLKKRPKIAVLGLNPHNAELRKKSEEINVIIPAINKLKKNKINVEGPLVSDTIFIKNYKKYDVIVGMFHDQVLSPFKAIYKFNAVNLTLGLSFLRLSPDHGIAFDLIKKNKASSESLDKCVELIKNFK